MKRRQPEGDLIIVREHMDRLLSSEAACQAIEAAELFFARNPAPSTEALWMAVRAMRASADTGAWGKTVDWAEKGLSMKLDDPEARGWLQLYLGIASLYLGNVFRADRALAEFRRIARKSPALEQLLPFGLYNWAVLNRFMRQHDRETKHLRQAAQEFARLGRTSYQMLCRLAVVWSLLLRGLPEQALAEFVTFEPDLQACADEDVQRNAELVQALYQSLIGNTAQSDSICHRLLQKVGLTPGMAADVTWLLGGNAKVRGEITLALRYAEEAHKLAMQNYWPLQLERIEELKRMSVAN